MKPQSINPKLIESFPEFYNNKHILALANKPRWTVSDKNKRPIDMVSLLNPNPEFNKIKGAKYINNECLVTLYELTNTPYNFSNNAFYIRANIDNYMVLDIEPSCPQDICNQLLQLPYLYAEKSMSGHGYHLLMPLPKNYEDYPNAYNKVKLQEEHKYYEIMIEHWITFTRRPIDQKFSTNELNTKTSISWEDIYSQLASKAKDTIHNDITIDIEKPNIPYEDEIIDIVTKMYKSRHTKTLEDFYNDHSRYEFSILGSLYYHLKNVIIAKPYSDHDYTNSEKAWLLFTSIQNIIEPRDKHEQIRDGLPFLLYSANNIIART